MKKAIFSVLLIIFSSLFILTQSSLHLHAASWETVQFSQFNSIQELESEWNYFYPWGEDHNGTAHMVTDSSNLFIQNGVLTLRATKRSDGKYNSGAIYSKHIVKITDEHSDYSLEIRAKAPYQTGTWPAFWLTHAGSWIAEMDVMEYKGTNTNHQNTYDNGNWKTVKTTVNNPYDWHTYKVYFNKTSSTQVNIHYYIDGNWKAMHKANFVGKPFWVIANLQMEGSSGSPGPSYSPYYIDYIKIDRTSN